MMVVILLGVPLAVLEVRSVDTSTKTVLATEARMLATTVSMQVSKASLDGTNSGPLGNYVSDMQKMIAPDHDATIDVDGQSPTQINGLPPGAPTFSVTYGIDNVLRNVGVHGVRIDIESHRAYLGDQELNLTAKEFDLLRVLVREVGRVVTRDQLMREVWDTTWWSSTKTLDMHISWLRKKLGDEASRPRFITTVRGVGFRFERG